MHIFFDSHFSNRDSFTIPTIIDITECQRKQLDFFRFVFFSAPVTVGVCAKVPACHLSCSIPGYILQRGLVRTGISLTFKQNKAFITSRRCITLYYSLQAHFLVGYDGASSCMAYGHTRSIGCSSDVKIGAKRHLQAGLTCLFAPIFPPSDLLFTKL